MDNSEVSTTPKINIKRLIRNIDNLGKYGIDENGGINRSLATDADIQSRQWISRYWRSLDLQIIKDATANIWGEYPYTKQKSLKPIVVGSHNDSVPEGGKYDGALGILMATEVCQTLLENKVQLKHPFKIISLTGEEANPYQLSTVGSKGITGIVNQKILSKFHHLVSGESLSRAIDRLGGNSAEIGPTHLNKDAIAAFLECHIEQGRRLFDAKQPVAVVEKITGIYRELVTIQGEANHAGTTETRVRRDALLAASFIDVSLRAIIDGINNRYLVGTMGYIQVAPNAANIIPGKAIFNLDIRSSDPNLAKMVVRQLDIKFQELVDKGFVINRKKVLDQAPVQMNSEIVSAFHEAIHENYPDSDIGLVSMAGHDAANMVRVGRSGMLFVQSIDGKSHCKEEFSKPNDIEIATDVLLKTVLKLDKELE